VSIAMAGSHTVQSHRVDCPPCAFSDERQSDSRELSMITLVGNAFQLREQASPPRRLHTIRDNSTTGDGAAIPAPYRR